MLSRSASKEHGNYSGKYLWSERDHLGRGATGSVYSGYHTETGEEVAVKAFDDSRLDDQRRAKYIQSEVEILRRVNHENIVKILALEETNNYKRVKVLIMEYCNGGTLLSLIENPMNRNGLQQSEFLLVLDHITKGMKYLRSINIVHRDVKPGNIMRHVTSRGETIYKLVDFGNARELEEGQEFMTIAGTAEYIHSQILAKCYGELNAVTANVDLWSIGATLYHAATGHIPFYAPYVGENERCRSMYRLTCQKESGVISGRQLHNGTIEWSKNLPETCRFSDDFKEIITRFIAGLLETDTSKEWSFDRFFYETDKILKMQTIHVFHLNSMKTIEIWMDPDENLDQFKEKLVEKTEVPKESQVLLIDNDFLEASVTSSSDSVSTFPKTTLENPIFMYSEDEVVKEIPLDSQIRQILKPLLLPQDDSIQNAIRLAQTAYYSSIDCKNAIDEYTQISESITKGIFQYVTVHKDKIIKLKKKVDNLKIFVDIVLHFADLAKLANKYFENAPSEEGANDKLNTIITNLNCLKKDYLEIREISTNLHNNYVKDDFLRDLNKQNLDKKCITHSCNNFMSDSKRNYDYFKKTDHNSSGVQAQFSTLIKKKIVNEHLKMASFFHEEIKPILMQKMVFLEDWYCSSKSMYSKIAIFNMRIQDFEKSLNATCHELIDLKNHWKASIITNEHTGNCSFQKVLQMDMEFKKILEETDLLTKTLSELKF